MIERVTSNAGKANGVLDPPDRVTLYVNDQRIEDELRPSQAELEGRL